MNGSDKPECPARLLIFSFGPADKPWHPRTRVSAAGHEDAFRGKVGGARARESARRFVEAFTADTRRYPRSRSRGIVSARHVGANDTRALINHPSGSGCRHPRCHGNNLFHPCIQMSRRPSLLPSFFSLRLFASYSPRFSFPFSEPEGKNQERGKKERNSSGKQGRYPRTVIPTNA